MEVSLLSLIIDQLDDRIGIEGEAVVMRNGGVPLVGKLHLAVLHGVHLPLLKLLVPFGCGIIVHGGLDLGILFVHKI